jgi:huntingtin-interacting protein 1-related protein
VPGSAGSSGKAAEMQQQIRILELEKELGLARLRLGELRKHAYHAEED